MNLELLERTPISGEFEETHFGRTDTNPLWIKFHPLYSKSWIGSFGKGEVGIVNRKVFEINNTTRIGILSNGAFYLIDTESQELIFETEDGHYSDFWILPNKNLIFLATNWNISVFKDKQRINELRPDYVDGIKFTEYKNDLLIGELYEIGNEWTEFELNTSSLKLKKH